MSPFHRFPFHPGIGPGAGLAVAGSLFCLTLTVIAGSGPSSITAEPVGSTALRQVTTAWPPPLPTASPSRNLAGAEVSAAETCVQTAFGGLNAVQRAGQLVMTGVPAGNPAKYRALVRKKHLGGVFLAGRTSQAPSTIRTAVERLAGQTTANAKVGLLVAADQEGGQVQSLRDRSWTTIPSARTQGTWTPANLADRTAAWVEQLKRAGVNMDLAPVADTVPAGTESKNPPVGVFDRQYGTSSAAVAAAVATVTSALADGSVIPTVKHFPGLGRSATTPTPRPGRWTEPPPRPMPT